MNDIEDDTRQTKRDIANRNFLEVLVMIPIIFLIVIVMFGIYLFFKGL